MKLRSYVFIGISNFPWRKQLGKKPVVTNTKHRLASLGWPRSAPVRLNSFDGAHPGQPPVPCLWSGSLGVTCGTCRHHEKASMIVWLALVRGSPEWALRVDPGKLIECTHCDHLGHGHRLECCHSVLASQTLESHGLHYWWTVHQKPVLYIPLLDTFKEIFVGFPD